MPIIPLCIGGALGLAIWLAAGVLRFNRDRSFYPTLLIVIASYYVLFALMFDRSVALEVAIASVFTAMAVAAALKWPVLAGWGLLLHGLFDFTRGGFIGDAGAPVWWPAFCGGVDVVLGLGLLGAYFLSSRRLPSQDR